jgi:hypothetical protein
MYLFIKVSLQTKDGASEQSAHDIDGASLIVTDDITRDVIGNKTHNATHDVTK